jgi:uncharacterized protein (DUF58 family)
MTDTQVAELAAPTRDGRFDAYLWLAISGFVVAMLRGRPEAAVLATPFALALALGVRGGRTLTLTWHFEMEAAQAIEGDRVHGTLVFDRTASVALEVAILAHDGLQAIAPADRLAWRVPAGTSQVRLPFTVTGRQWGRFTLDEVTVKARRQFGLFQWEEMLGTGPAIRILPTVERLNKLLDPASSRASWGIHRSRSVGSGSEFAEVRPYQPGDRMRDLNWRVTARLRDPHVNRHIVERSGEVVLIIDTSIDTAGTSSAAAHAALARGARAAWALASVHLSAHDRVGLVTAGEVSTWLSPNSGERARYQLLETMLSVGGDVVAGRRTPVTYSTNSAPDKLIPPAALVVAVTPLWNTRIVTSLQAMRAKGRPVAAVIIGMSDVFPDEHEHHRQAARLYQQLIDARVESLKQSGVPTVDWDPGQPVAAFVRTLREVAGRTSSGVRR